MGAGAEGAMCLATMYRLSIESLALKSSLHLSYGADALFEEERYLQRSMRQRLAFREFGTVLGIKCDTSDSSLGKQAERIIGQWQKFMESETPDDLRAITMVMYAAALVPGGKSRLYESYCKNKIGTDDIYSF